MTSTHRKVLVVLELQRITESLKHDREMVDIAKRADELLNIVVDLDELVFHETGKQYPFQIPKEYVFREHVEEHVEEHIEELHESLHEILPIENEPNTKPPQEGL